MPEGTEDDTREEGTMAISVGVDVFMGHPRANLRVRLCNGNVA
ncbi:MAG: hypothetical protein NXI30_15995 [bacterium]|nr:hypothetical protein [bacterium]